MRGSPPSGVLPRERKSVGHLAFADGEHCYLYDTATNAVVGVPPAVHAVLDDYLRLGRRHVLRAHAGRFPAEALRGAVDWLGACRRSRMLRPIERLDYLPFAGVANMRRQYARGLRAMTLGITEDCNQRCRYCPFGGAARQAQRHVPMSAETARRSVDLLLSRADPAVPPTLELYGGEPVLNWPVVQEVVEYVRCTLRRPDVEVVLCTNATLLDRPRLELLAAHRVALQISLDGPVHVHDRARVQGKGRGTHARVLRVLAGIRRRDPAYYRDFVRPHCTFDLGSDLVEVFRFFSRPAFRDLRVSFSYRTGGTEASAADRARHEAQLDDLVEEHLRSLREGRPFPRALFASIMHDVIDWLGARAVGPPGRPPQPNGACVPGQYRVFVSGGGSLHACSNFSRAGSEIGDCRRGIDRRKAQSALRAYAALCNRTCQGCWAWRLCAQCFVHCVGADGRLSRSRKERSCRRERERIVRALRRYVHLWRNEPAGARAVKGTLRHRVAQRDA